MVLHRVLHWKVEQGWIILALSSDGHLCDILVPLCNCDRTKVYCIYRSSPSRDTTRDNLCVPLRYVHRIYSAFISHLPAQPDPPILPTQASPSSPQLARVQKVRLETAAAAVNGDDTSTARSNRPLTTRPALSTEPSAQSVLSPNPARGLYIEVQRVASARKIAPWRRDRR